MMKILRLDLDADENPATIQVEMTIAEAAAIVRVFGTYTIPGFRDQHHIDYPEDIYQGLTGSVFNRFWDDGVDGYFRGDS
jgi:hypothetical protein